MGKAIVTVLALAIIFGFLFWKFAPSFSSKPQNSPVTLNIWGLWDDANFLKGAVDQYQKFHPNVKIIYTPTTTANLRSRLQTQIPSGQGPDIFPIHNSWLPMFLKGGLISPVPSTLVGVDDYSKLFYPVAKDSFVSASRIYGIPLSIDGLALYYNEDILKATGVSVPKYWIPTSLGEDLIDASNKVVVKDLGGNIKTAGVALGDTSNVDYWSDILGLLFEQEPGAKLDSPNTSQGADVLSFYTSFLTDPRKKTWDASLEPSTTAFEKGNLAFLFAPSTVANDIRAANPSLHFKVTTVPQLPGDPTAAWASFWGLTVSGASQNPDTAWDFISFLAGADIQRQLYTERAKTKIFGDPYSRVDLQSDLLGDSLVGAFVAQGQYYKSWYLSSNTGDNALNDEMIQVYSDAVNNVLLRGVDPNVALSNANKGVQQVLDKYVRNPAPSSSNR